MKKNWVYLYALACILSFSVTYLYYSNYIEKPKETFVVKEKIFLRQKLPYIHVKKLQAEELGYLKKKKLFLDFAITQEERQWGMMGRSGLEKDQGLGFIFPKKSYRTFWMFNCLVDLSLAYLDDRQVIKEIHDLKAYPEKVAKGPKITTLDDLHKVSREDPIVSFFRQTGKKSSFPSRFALEMQLGWFKENQYGIGDVVQFDPVNKNSYIYSTLDFSNNFHSIPTLIEFPETDLHPISGSQKPLNCQLVFLSEDDIVKEIIFYQSFKDKKLSEEVVIPNFPFKKVVILPKKHHQLAKVFIGSPLLLRSI